MARLTDEDEDAWALATQDVKSPKRKPRAPAAKKEAKKIAVAAPVARPAKKAVPAAPLEPLARREAAKRFSTRIEATLDLHGMTQDEAHAALIGFLQRAHRGGKRHIAIITGKGRTSEGVLRRVVPRWLELADLRGLVSSIAHAAPAKGGDGVLHVWLKK